MFFYNDILMDPSEIQIDNPENTTENTSERLQDNVSTEQTEASTQVVPDAVIIQPYDPEYSDIKYITPYDDETSEYSTQTIDNRPYMSKEVVGASMDDIFTYVLSIRNIVLLWFLMWLLLKFKTMIHNVNMKYMEGRK